MTVQERKRQLLTHLNDQLAGYWRVDQAWAEQDHPNFTRARLLECALHEAVADEEKTESEVRSRCVQLLLLYTQG